MVLRAKLAATGNRQSGGGTYEKLKLDQLYKLYQLTIATITKTRYTYTAFNDVFAGHKPPNTNPWTAES